MIFHVTPVAKPRQTRRDKWAKRPSVVKYREFKDEVLRQAGDWRPDPDEPLEVAFYIPMPKSWSDKKRSEMLAAPHQQTPDIDNLLKAFLECWGEDSAFWDVRATKRWGYDGQVSVAPS